MIFLLCFFVLKRGRGGGGDCLQRLGRSIYELKQPIWLARFLHYR